MTPRQQIANLYWKHPQPRTFDTDEALHRITGYVIEADGYFLMGRGVDIACDEEFIVNPMVSFPRSRQNCWFVYAYCGPLNLIYHLQPYVLPRIAWIRRNGKLRSYSTESFQAYVESRCKSKPSDLTTLAIRAV